MTIGSRHNMTFPLRLGISLKAVAVMLAQRDGVSLNHFINLAVAEKVRRLESETFKEQETIVTRAKFVAASESSARVDIACD